MDKKKRIRLNLWPVVMMLAMGLPFVTGCHAQKSLPPEQEYLFYDVDAQGRYVVPKVSNIPAPLSNKPEQQ